MSGRVITVDVSVNKYLVHLKFSLPVSLHSRHSHSGFHFFLIVFAFVYTIKGFAMLFLAAVAASGATMLLAPVLYLRSKPQSSARAKASTMLVFICLLCCPM